jgi:hypothetical protein
MKVSAVIVATSVVIGIAIAFTGILFACLSDLFVNGGRVRLLGGIGFCAGSAIALIPIGIWRYLSMRKIGVEETVVEETVVEETVVEETVVEETVVEETVVEAYSPFLGFGQKNVTFKIDGRGDMKTSISSPTIVFSSPIEDNPL